MRVAVIGAGMAGLTCARELEAAGASVTIVDKGRAVGGRMATRTIDGARFDHGAQHFSVRSPEFASVIDPLRDDGTVTTWFESQSLTEPERGIEPRFTGRSGMRRVPEALAGGMDVRLGAAVSAVEIERAAVAIWTGATRVGVFDAVVCTAPVPQSVALLSQCAIPLPGHIARHTDRFAYEPCLVALATPVRGPALVEGHLAGPGIVAWIADNLHKGTSDAPSVTLHASAEFSSTNLEREPGEWATIMIEEAERLTGCRLELAGTHRWRYSIPTHAIDAGAMRFDNAGVPVVLAGEIFAGARVEGAFTSGRAAARALMGTD